MNYRKVAIDGYIIGVGKTAAEGNITSDEYSRLTEIFLAMPEAPEGYCYMLRENEMWELIEKEPEPTDPEIDDSEALGIMLGEETE